MPGALALDTAGNLYVCDGSSRIRKISTAGIITTVAGNGSAGYAGDGGPATSAMLSSPSGIAVDAAGNLFIADAGNERVRMVSASPAGVIFTVAGNGLPGYSGDGGPATSAQLSDPSGVAVDPSGNVYIADCLNNAIRLLRPTSAFGPVPVVNINGLVDSAGYQRLVAPGGIASLFGVNLAPGPAAAVTVPLPETLGNTSVVINNVPLPLFYVSPTQINFQVPWDLSAAFEGFEIAVVSASGTSGPQTVPLSSYAPGIFTTNSSGMGQGAVTNATTGQLAVPATPVARGQYVTIYCSGLGEVYNVPALGAAAPASPPAWTYETPTVLIGGISALVQFSGLAPGFVGLYQVNVEVPPNVTPGPAVSLILSMGGGSSNTVTIAVQ
jgi:uncharacterized protein (TIGR03437 family)